MQLYSRNLKSLDRQFPTILDELVKIPANSFCLDGEIVALDGKGRSRFQFLQKRINVRNLSTIRKLEAEFPAYYFVFDLIACEGYDLRGVTLAERQQILKAMLPKGDWIRQVSGVRGQGTEFLRLACEKGLEGIVVKDLTSTYQSQRSHHWLKIKCVQHQQFVITGYTSPSGGRRYFGALVLGLFEDGELVYAGKTGSGFDQGTLESTYKKLKKRERRTSPFKSFPAEVKVKSWVRPDLVCEVKFNEWTASGYLRAPIFGGLREDLDPRDCEREKGLSIGESNSDLPYEFLSNLQKVFWPREGYTKRHLVEFYHRISDMMIPYLKDRPMVLERFPDGIEGESFYQKNAPEFLPEWIPTADVRSDSAGRTIRYILCNDRQTLVYLANLACISLHPWSSRVNSLDHPDFLIMDLDPSQGVAFSTVSKVARKVGQILDQVDLNSYPKTSGATGIHILVPLDPCYSYDDVRNFAEIIARMTVSGLEEIVTLERSIEKRKNKVYLDYLQNGRGKTIASPYCLRPGPAALVSTPLEWKEVNSRLRPESFNLKTIFRRLNQKGDLLGKMLQERQSLKDALHKLETTWKQL